MAKYAEVKGITIQTTDSDPVANVGSWASGGALNTGRQRLGASGQSHSGSIGFGGASSSTNFDNKTETYNGSSWTEVNDLNTGRHAMGTASQGTSTATLAFTGNTSPGNTNAVESWDGTNWTEVAETATSRRYASGFGTQTAAILAAGYTTTNIDNVESWNGSAWSEIAEISTGRNDCQGAIGISTAGMIIGGTPGGSPLAICEYWNGSSWTEVADLNTGRGTGGSGGVFTSGITFGGETPNTTKTEEWNGSAWTETADMATQRNTLGGSGSGSTVALAFGGDDPSNPKTGLTEEWAFPSGPSFIVEGDAVLVGGGIFKGVVRASSPSTVWASGGNTNTDRGYGFSFGPQNAAQIAGGETPPNVVVSEQYDGTSWTEVNDLNNTGGVQARAGSGTETDAVVAGPSGSTPYGNAEKWNGTSFSETAEMNTTKYSRASTLTSGPAAVVFGGTPATANTETFDGTAWAEVGDLNASKYAAQGVGSPTAGMNIGGYEPGGYTVNVESWNGTSWTEGTNTNSAQGYGGAAGASSSNAVKFGGSGGPTGFSAITELWNGSTWTEIGDLSANYTGNMGTGSSAAALNIPGKTAPTTYPGSCEEFTGDLTLQTITVS